MHAADSTRLDEQDAAATRLRLKRVFLWTLVLSLTACTLAAVVVLLIDQFSDTSVRVLLTLAALALHSGAALACAHSLERRRRPALSVAGLVLFGLNFAILLFCTWGGALQEETRARAWNATVALLIAYLLAIPCAELYSRNVRRILALAGLAAVAIAFAWWLAFIWSEDLTHHETFSKGAAIVAIIAFSLSHTCLLFWLPDRLRVRPVLTLAIVSIWALAIGLSVTIIEEPRDDMWFRALGAVGVVDASSSLALVILARLRQVARVEGLQTAARQVELRCPRCLTLQTVNVGPSNCSACGLKLHVEIEEPRCPKCNYLLWQLPEPRCPECGTPF
jgi:peptidoglycan/LPS O-acetylase OafA/YrhL